MKQLTVHVDGWMAGTQYAGAAAVARTSEGYFVGWLSRQLPMMTNNEAEYYATQLGLTLAAGLGAKAVLIVSDSEVVVRQMSGLSRVMSQRLKRLHQQTCRQTAVFEQVSFRHVPREQNCLADALATEAINGRLVQMPGLVVTDPPEETSRPTLANWLRQWGQRTSRQPDN